MFSVLGGNRWTDLGIAGSGLNVVASLTVQQLVIAHVLEDKAPNRWMGAFFHRAYDHSFADMRVHSWWGHVMTNLLFDVDGVLSLGALRVQLEEDYGISQEMLTSLFRCGFAD